MRIVIAYGKTHSLEFKVTMVYTSTRNYYNLRFVILSDLAPKAKTTGCSSCVCLSFHLQPILTI